MSDKPSTNDAQDREILRKAKPQILREAKSTAAEIQARETRAARKPDPPRK